MNTTKYKINPIMGIQKSCKGGEYGIHKYNDMCFSIISGYNNNSDPYMASPELQKICLDFIEEKRIQTYGVGHCDHQQPYPPLTLMESPNYFVRLLNQNVPVEQALKTAKEMCIRNKPNIKEECIEYQELLYNSLEEYAPKMIPATHSDPVSQACEKKYPPITVANIVKNVEDDTKEDKNDYRWLLFVLIVVVLAFSYSKYK
jgi:hypothetical protein